MEVASRAVELISRLSMVADRCNGLADNYQAVELNTLLIHRRDRLTQNYHRSYDQQQQQQ